MRINIITVYGSYNHGSYLQAVNLYKAFAPYGDVYLVDTGTRKWNALRTAYRRTKLFARYTKFTKIPKILVYECVEAFTVKKLWKSTEHINIIDADLCVLGSDEIWNISRKECQYPVFWGYGVKTGKISYAPSINTAGMADFKKYPNYIKYLNEIDNISVRDMNTKITLSHYTNKNISVVLDPTLLFDPEVIPFHYHKDYIAVYSFVGQISEEAQKEIREFAKKRNLDLIATGQTVPWCDKCVHSKKGNPFYIYKNAKYVITSTFHGTAYAINYRKDFITFGNNNTKILELLDQFDLKDRNVTVGTDIKTLLDKKVDVQSIDKKLKLYREKSFDYINNAIMGRDKL